MTGTDLLIDALACYRLTHLVQKDDVWPLPELRGMVMDRWGDKRISQLVDCPWCISIYIAGVILGARWALPRAWPALARVLAGSATAGLLAEVRDALEDT